MISSLANPQVKRIRRLQKDKRFRYREQTFVVEGTRMIKELTAGQQKPDAVYCTEDWLADPAHEVLLHQGILEENRPRAELVTHEVMAAMSDTETASGVLATLPMTPLPLPMEPTMVLILDAVTTPGNLGTMLRTAGAAAVDAVLLAPGCVDAYNPKVVRGAMGAHFRLPIHDRDWNEIAAYCDSLTIWLSETSGSTVYTAVAWQQPSALIIGNEARGAGRDAHQTASGTVSIPMAKETESLNAATATAVLLFEAFRQRGFAEKSTSANQL